MAEPLIDRDTRRRLKQAKTEQGVVVLGTQLRDAREEHFAQMVCDGLPIGRAYERAGFTSSAKDAAYLLWHLSRVQERAAAILNERRTQGAVSLPEVTTMLKRVFAGAHSEGEFSAAHNAAFSLARLYGHVTDRATLEVIRRPSRDPDAPSEQALSAWVEALPGPGLGALPGPGLPVSEASFLRVSEASNLALSDVPAAPLGEALPGPEAQISNDINALPVSGPVDWMRSGPGPGPHMHVDVMNVDVNSEFSNDFNGLAMHVDGHTPGRSENGAPNPTVTGTPNGRAQSELLANGGTPYTPIKKTGPPLADEGTVYPSAEDLF